MPARLEIFDPAMCCTTGVCGPTSDPSLARLAADVEWLRARGVAVERHGLSQEPQAFVANARVRAALDAGGVARLPLVLANGRVVAEGSYPDRAALARALGLDQDEATETSPVSEPSACCAPPANGQKPRVSKGRCC